MGKNNTSYGVIQVMGKNNSLKAETNQRNNYHEFLINL